MYFKYLVSKLELTVLYIIDLLTLGAHVSFISFCIQEQICILLRYIQTKRQRQRQKFIATSYSHPATATAVMTNNNNNNDGNQAAGDANAVEGPEAAQPSTSNANGSNAASCQCK